MGKKGQIFMMLKGELMTPLSLLDQVCLAHLGGHACLLEMAECFILLIEPSLHQQARAPLADCPASFSHFVWYLV